jgi:hypothetical protein
VLFVLPPASLSFSSGGLADRSDWERVGRLPCIACRFRVSPSSWSSALDLGAQILGALGFLVIALVLLWLEHAAVMGSETLFL